MREWLTDEERERDNRNAWKFHLEAWIIGATVLLGIAGAVSWLM